MENLEVNLNQLLKIMTLKVFTYGKMVRESF